MLKQINIERTCSMIICNAHQVNKMYADRNLHIHQHQICYLTVLHYYALHVQYKPIINISQFVMMKASAFGTVNLLFQVTL